ncbi:MAG: hypothetical protein KGZ81_01165 [Flavobacteriales bacterium]|nr:hypothetical protein [Flavobacteriales bacterium]
MKNLKQMRLSKLVNDSNPDSKFIRDMIEQSISFVEDHTELLSVDVVSLDDIFDLRPDEIISINKCYIQKVIAFHTNFIAIGKWMEDDAKLYTIMFASTKPDAFVYDVKNDFGIEIKR